MKRVLIAGGTGMIGKEVTELLKMQSSEVTILSTSARKEIQTSKGIKTVQWKPHENWISGHALGDYDAIINLAGHTINCRWTAANRQKIMDSRVHSANFISALLSSGQIRSNVYITSSAIGIYSNSGEIKMESHPKGNDFLAQVCKAWEGASESISALGIRRVVFRLPVVLSNSGGMLSTLKPLVKLTGGAVMGNGKQHMSFVYVKDVARAILFALDGPIVEGTFNLAAPEIPTAKEFAEDLAYSLRRKLFMVRTPAFPIRMFLGERAGLVLDDQQIDSSTIRQLGFDFQFPTLESTLNDIYPH